MILRGIAALAISATVVGCTFARSDDFSVSGKQVQREHLGAIRTVVIRCYCPDRAVKEAPGAMNLELRITANHSSVGYRGDQSKPYALGDVSFVEARRNGALILDSPEHTYIHNALIVTKLRVLAPVGVEVRFEPIEYHPLEGRQVPSEGT